MSLYVYLKKQKIEPGSTNIFTKMMALLIKQT